MPPPVAVSMVTHPGKLKNERSGLFSTSLLTTTAYVCLWNGMP
jgi:hypothetical protein